jgi:hypothetical protein
VQTVRVEVPASTVSDCTVSGPVFPPTTVTEFGPGSTITVETPGATVTACDLTVLTPPVFPSTVTETGPTITVSFPPVTFTESTPCEFTKGPHSSGGGGGGSSNGGDKGPSGYGAPTSKGWY